MIQSAPKPLTLDDFIALYPEDGGRDELRYGAIVEMRPMATHMATHMDQIIAAGKSS